MKKYVYNSFITKSPSEYKNGTAAVTNLPVTLYTDGEPISAYTLKGNTSVSGTPSPQNPITIDGVGNKTANLLNPNTDVYPYYLDYNGKMLQSSSGSYSFLCPCEPNTLYYITFPQIPSGLTSKVVTFSSNPSLGDTGDGFESLGGRTGFTYTTNSTAHYICVNSYSGSNPPALTPTEFYSQNMMSTEDIDFEPYGKYKISILKGLTALTPIYLSQQLLKVGDYTDDVNSSGTATYNVAKYEFTGTERVQKNYSEDPTSYLYYTSMTIAADEVICTHLPYGAAIPKTDVGITGRANNNILYLNFGADVMNAQTSGNTANGLKEYLAAQYAAGTPVTVYYVLTTPTTESVTAPEITTTGGTVTLDVDTTVKPSELDLTYHGWHEHQPLKRENGAWE